MPYIPQFNKLSLNEMSYAPTLMRQQHDDAIAKQMELAEALKFDYLKQDAPGLEPILQKYNEDIEDVSKQIAQQGFTHDLKNKVLGLRSQYVTDDKVRQYKKNYADAMQGWEETKKSLIQRGASGDLINKQKAAYFGAYKGAYDDEGFKQEFNAGRTSGVYDVMEDAKKAFAGIGTTGQIVGSSGTSVQQKVTKDRKGNPMTYFEVTDNKTGQKLTNLDQRQAVAQYLKSEYGDESTDRGLYAKIAELAPEHIDNIVDQVSRSMAENRYAQLPQTDTNISGINADSSRSGQNQQMYSQYVNLQKGEGDSDEIADEDAKIRKWIDPNDKSFNAKRIKEQLATTPSAQLSAAWAERAGYNYPDMRKPVYKELSEEDKSAINAFNKRKDDFKTVYDFVKKQGKTDEDFLNITSAIKRNNTATLETNVGFDDPDALKNIWGKIWENNKQGTFIKMKDINRNEPEEEVFGKDPVVLSVEDMNKKIKKAGLTKDEFFNRQTTIDSKGNIHFQLNGEEYAVDSEVIPKQATGFQNTFDKLKKGFNDYTLSKKELEDLSKKAYSIGDNIFYLEVNPENPFDRKLMAQDKLGLSEPQQVPLSAIQVEITKAAHQGISHKNEIK